MAPSGAPVIVVMGVAGSGKTTVARLLAERLGAAFQEGDALHPQANVEKMSDGIPLTDADRAPWLRAIAAVIDGWRARGEAGVVACSALRRAYRDMLIGPRRDVALVYLEGSRALIGERMVARQGHFMPASLLDSQFAALEPPDADETPVVVPVADPPETIAASVIARLGLQPAG